MGLWIKNADGTIERTAGGGADGQPGVDGEDGQPGVDGNMWHVGSGAPASTLGDPGDYYLDGTDGWVYVKRNDSSWTNLYVNLTGPPGGGGGGDFLPLSGGTVTGDLLVHSQDRAVRITDSGLAQAAEIAYTAQSSTNPAFGRLSGYSVVLRAGSSRETMKDVLTAHNNGNVYATGDLQVDGSATVGGKEVSVSGHLHSQYAPTSHTHSYSPTNHTHDKVGGLGLAGAAVPPSGAQILRSGSNGYTYFGWINTVSGETTGTPNRIYASTDNFLRYMTPANFRAKVIDGNTISAANGTATSPGFRFNSDKNTGMYRPGSKALELMVGGERAVYFGNTQSVSGGVFMPLLNARPAPPAAYPAVMVLDNANGGMMVVATSARRHLKNIEAVSFDATNSVYDLKPVWYRSKTNNAPDGHSHYGFVADDVAAIDPRLVTYSTDDEGQKQPETVNDHAVIALLVSAVKSQRDTIADLTARIETLEGQTRL